MVLVRNIEKLVELYNAEQILGMDVRQVVKALEERWDQEREKGVYRITVMIEFQGKEVTPDMLKDSCQIKFLL